MLVRIARKDTKTVVAALAKQIRKLPERLRRLSVVRDFETGGGLIKERVWRILDGCYAACLL